MKNHGTLFFLPALLFSCINNYSPTKHEIIKNEDRYGRGKIRDISILLEDKINETELSKFGDYLYEGVKDYQKVWITYKIKDDDPSPAWAVTNYTPKKEVRIIGSTLKEDSLMWRKAQYHTPGELISAWKAGNGILGTVYALSIDGDNYLFTGFYKDGGVETDTISFNGNRFDMPSDEYAMVNDDASLSFFSENGEKISDLKHIKDFNDNPLD